MFKIDQERKVISPNKGKQPDKPKPGIYKSRIISVSQAPNYSSGEAVVITYRLTDSQGKRYSHKETFRIQGKASQREKDFDDYILKAGFQDYDDLVGLKEKVKLENAEKDGTIFTNIVERDLVAYPPGVEVVDDVAAQ